MVNAGQNTGDGLVLVDHQQLGGGLVEGLGGDQFGAQVVQCTMCTPCTRAIFPDIPCKYKITQAASQIKAQQEKLMVLLLGNYMPYHVLH